VAVFRLNVEEYPNAWNPWDSLGEAYLGTGDTAHAIESYRRSVQLNPKSAGGIAALKRLGVRP
jgi:cytochrome c-type biogenesis protein CcmH/NrfG